jgi:hypothetical protein
MSQQTYEIRCPQCGSVVPVAASGCPTCASARENAKPAVEAARAATPVITALGLKDYHQLVRANYLAVEGVRAIGGPGAGFRFRRYLPFVLVLLGLLVGAAVAFGRL